MNIESNNLESLAKLTPPCRRLRSSNLSSVNDNRKEKLRKACQDLEALFMEQLMKAMRKTVPESGLLGKGFAHETYREMLDKELVKRMSQNSGIGLAKVLYRQLTENYDDEKI